VGDGNLILVGGALLAAGLVMSLVATRVRLPALLLFLGIGMLIGDDGLGWITFDDYELARTVGVIALALILFEGGLTSGLLEVRPVLPTAISLAVVGTIGTAVITGLAAGWLFDLSTLEGLLLGSILASTDGAATFAVLRGSSLKRRLARTLEAESGLNDPVAVLLVLGFIDWLQQPGYGLADMAVLFVSELGIGAAVGLAVGWLSVAGFRRARLESAGLYPVASLASAALAFGGADTLGGSGFLAVYLTGLALGSARIPAKLTITAFHQGLAWVAQMGLFFSLGLLVFPSRLGDVVVEGTVLALVILLVGAPRLHLRRDGGRPRAPDRANRARGGGPARGGARRAGDVPGDRWRRGQPGLLRRRVLRGPALDTRAGPRDRADRAPARGDVVGAGAASAAGRGGTIRGLGAEVLEHTVRAGDAISGRRVRDLGLPREAVVNVIVRGNEAIPPRGSTILRDGDRLHVLLRQETAVEVRGLLDRWTAGPIGPPPRSAGRPAARPSSPCGRRVRAPSRATSPGRRRWPATRSWRSCASAAASPARSSSSTTAATPSRARSSRSARARACVAGPSGGCASCTPTTTRPPGCRTSTAPWPPTYRPDAAWSSATSSNATPPDPTCAAPSCGPAGGGGPSGCRG
jgi:cell volume regulation protein A